MSGKPVRATSTAQPPESGVDAAVDAGQRQMRRLERAEALQLLGGVSLGRVVFTQDAMPAIRPVNHLLDGDQVIIRSHAGATVLSQIGGVVAYEADAIDPDTHLGWSVVVTGWASLVSDPELIARYQRLLKPWISQEMDQVIRIAPTVVTGYVLTRVTAN